MAVVNFKPDMFSFLNITSLGSDLVADDIDCGFTCLEIPSCFSYNVAAYPDINGKFLCEPLPSDKFNNSDKFTDSTLYHHFSIPVSTTELIFALAFISKGIKIVLKIQIEVPLSFARSILCTKIYCSDSGSENTRSIMKL